MVSLRKELSETFYTGAHLHAQPRGSGGILLTGSLQIEMVKSFSQSYWPGFEASAISASDFSTHY